MSQTTAASRFERHRSTSTSRQLQVVGAHSKSFMSRQKGSNCTKIGNWVQETQLKMVHYCTVNKKQPHNKTDKITETIGANLR